MSSLPTREEIAEIVQAEFYAGAGRGMPASLAAKIADALLVLLRPAWERMDANQRSDDDHALCVEAKDYDMIQRELKQTADRCDALRTSLARKDEALRACVEALAWYPFGGLDGLLSEVERSLRANGAECTDPVDCGSLGCLLAKIHHARAALARPDVKEIQ